MPARSSAALIATPPRSTAAKPVSAPSNRPIGVRAPLTITDPGMTRLLAELTALLSPAPDSRRSWCWLRCSLARRLVCAGLHDTDTHCVLGCDNQHRLP